MGETKAGIPRLLVVGTAIAGLIAALIVIATRYYELRKARLEAIQAESQSRPAPPPSPSVQDESQSNPTPKSTGMSSIRPKSKLVGKWYQKARWETITLTFTDTGLFTAETQQEGNPSAPLSDTCEYKIVDDRTIELSGLRNKLVRGDWEITVDDELVLHLEGLSGTYKRTKPVNSEEKPTKADPALASRLVGKWERQAGKSKLSLEFTKGGTVVLTTERGDADLSVAKYSVEPNKLILSAEDALGRSTQWYLFEMISDDEILIGDNTGGLIGVFSYRLKGRWKKMRENK